MRIKSFSYSSENWVLQKIDLQEVNLLVGTNGTGKSKTLFYLNLLKLFIKSGDFFLQDEHGIWEISWLTDSNQTLTYTLGVKLDIEELDGIVSNESLFLESKILLQRQDDNSCQVFSEKSGELDTFNPPVNELALLSRRDTKEYPYIEKIIEWAKNSYELQFSSINVENESVQTESNYEQYPKLFSKLNPKHQERIITDFNSIGFKISTIKYESRGNNNHYLVLKELGINKDIYQDELSQGMMRTLCLFVYLEYLISKNKKATLLIDDLGEGLDYLRATELGKIIFKRCKENDIQLVATSNDSFLMDVVNIDCWNVLTRKGKIVTALNKSNHPELFRKFKFTGLSNFDFFSSDYIDSRL
jgi:energy-coupling factor transporter ATP-binding protein EcfA2